jgi:hypothetical protein
MWKNLPAHTRASLLAALAGLVTLNGCSRAAPEAKAPSPADVSTANQPQTTLAEQPLADSLAFVAALALIQTTSALLPATAVSGGAPSMTTDTAPGSQPTLTALPTTEPVTTTEVWTQAVATPEPTTPATVVVNNYYVQQAPSPETEIAPVTQPEQLIVIAGGGRFVPAARGNRGTTPPAPTVAAPTAPLSAGSMVATGSPLSTGSMVARGSGLTAPNTTTLLPPALPLQSPTTPPAQNPPRRGNRAGQ